MTIVHFLTGLFCRLDERMKVLPERTRLFRLFKTHQRWISLFLASLTVLRVVDSEGIELLQPIREGRSRAPAGKANSTSAGSAAANAAC
jgi:hypothetical protein